MKSGVKSMTHFERFIATKLICVESMEILR